MMSATSPLTPEKTDDEKIINRRSSDQFLKKTSADNIWFCCKRGKTDARLVQYLTTVVFSFTILIFAIVQLVRLPTGLEQNTYISLITLVFGIFIPTPRVKIAARP